jgi:Uma2 family endonuclease
VAPAPRLMTVQEYFRTPETLQPTELIFGVLRVADSPLIPHQSAVGDLFRALDAHVRARALGHVLLSPLDVVLDERRALIVQPDLLFVSHERAGILQQHVMGAPDLVIEVLSPHPRIGKTNERIAWFAEYGVRECWLVHQDRRDVTVIEFVGRTIAEHRVFASRDVIHSSVLPEFAATLDDLLQSKFA